ncbi:MAG: hypothetical protein QOE36_1494 [Gaiellaceae bacterium]|jgi:hypothetical protein|nr:hypothetical protein [Gaiellaceae bacterium]
MIDRATPKTIRLAIAEAAEGRPSMLEANTKMPLPEAAHLATTIVRTTEFQDVRCWTNGSWLHIAPAA